MSLCVPPGTHDPAASLRLALLPPQCEFAHVATEMPGADSARLQRRHAPAYSVSCNSSGQHKI